ncbi:MAG: hypothetical protein JWR18_2541 [Segetibacter sp.]|nr:hypothetical protein [Segetibacter sp.]
MLGQERKTLISNLTECFNYEEDEYEKRQQDKWKQKGATIEIRKLLSFILIISLKIINWFFKKEP